MTRTWKYLRAWPPYLKGIGVFLWEYGPAATIAALKEDHHRTEGDLGVLDDAHFGAVPHMDAVEETP
jgi:hypothetical protein